MKIDGKSALKLPSQIKFQTYEYTKNFSTIKSLPSDYHFRSTSATHFSTTQSVSTTSNTIRFASTIYPPSLYCFYLSREFRGQLFQTHLLSTMAVLAEPNSSIKNLSRLLRNTDDSKVSSCRLDCLAHQRPSDLSGSTLTIFQLSLSLPYLLQFHQAM